MAKKTYSDVMQVDCRANAKAELVFCTLTSRSPKKEDSQILTLTYAGFSGTDMKVYMSPSGITAYRPSGKSMKCKVDGTRLICTT